MKRCAFLTLEIRADFVIDDELAYPALRQLGWQVEAIPWDRPGVAWDDYDAVVIRSSWDYQKDPEGFLVVLEEVERSSAQLFNSLDLVRWNLSKSYLQELEAGGVPIVPTTWRDRLRPGELGQLVADVSIGQTGEIVLKPVVSANADGAYRLGRQAASERALEIEAYYAQRPLMAQPFARSVVEEGEYSLFFFNGTYSHAVLKTPKAEDFRSQEEHGSHVRPADPEARLLAVAEQALAVLKSSALSYPLYARVDLVRSNGGDAFWLMEFELIEPALYFRMDPDSPARFARAFVERISG